MRTFRAALVSGFLAYRGLFPWATRRLIFPTLVLTPVLQLATFTLMGAYLGSQPVGFYALGNAVQLVARASVFAGTVVVAAERANGTLSGAVAAPMNSLVTFVGRLVPSVITGMVTGCVMVAIAAAFTRLPVPAAALPSTALLILLIAVSCSALGIALGATGLYIRDTYFLPNIAVYLMMLLCGVDFSPGQEPSVIRVIGQFLPETHGLSGIRQAAGGSRPVLAAAGAELLVAVCYGCLAFMLLSYFEHRARARATVDLGA